MLNNKGQSLVMFVLVIPVILIILILVLDIGRMYLERRELDNINYIALNYGIDNYEMENVNEKLSEIIKKNDEDIIIIKNEINDDKLYLATEKKYDGYFLGFISDDFVIVKSTYVGYQNNGKKYIERVN